MHDKCTGEAPGRQGDGPRLVRQRWRKVPPPVAHVTLPQMPNALAVIVCDSLGRHGGEAAALDHLVDQLGARLHADVLRDTADRRRAVHLQVFKLRDNPVSEKSMYYQYM